MDDNLDNTQIENMITAISRVIDDICDRTFYSTSETRYYTALRSDYIDVDDLLSVTTLKTDEDGDRVYEVTWQATDFDLMPFNANLDGWAYTYIETTPNGDYSFPKNIAKGVEIAGSFGFASTTPSPIREACILGSNRLMKRMDTPLGVAASFPMGELAVQVQKLTSDPDFMAFLSPYIKRW